MLLGEHPQPCRARLFPGGSSLPGGATRGLCRAQGSEQAPPGAVSS